MTKKLSYGGCQHRLWIAVIIFCMLQIWLVDKLQAQHYSWEEFVEKISVDEYDDYGELNPLLEDLNELHEHPFNLNTATKEDLERLPFLDDEEIEEILAYVYQYGPMESIGELMLIDRLDYQTRQFLSLFVYVGKPAEEKKKITWKDLWKSGRHEMMTRMDVPLYERDGYKVPEDEVLLKNPNKVYLGNALYHNVRYTYKYKDRLYWGFTAEKDAGEPFGSHGNKAYDSYSFHFLLKDCGMLRTLALGDYRLSFGEGLVVSTDFSFGKSTLFNMSSFRPSIKKFSSVSETNFFRGAAATLRFGKVDVLAFYSYLPVDATLRNDGTISSLKTDGLHRTLLEVSKKHNVVNQSMGGNVMWNARHVSLGMTVLYEHFDKHFSKGSQLYRTYYPDGSNFLNASVHYGWHNDKFLLSGETAFSDVYNGWATLNKVVYRFNNQYSLIAMQRFFAYQYVGMRANAFSEGGAVRNESGFYVGAEAAPLNELKMSAYVDYFYFPWPKFATPHSSDGVDATFQADCMVSEQWDLSGRYQLKRKERYGEPYLYHKLKIQAQYTPCEELELRGVGRYTQVRDQYGQHVRGSMAGCIVHWRERKGRFNVAASYVYFDSEDYKAPMAFYEPSLLYAFSFMTMYGRGMRAALTARWDVSRSWMLMLKYGATGYTDRKEIGDGLQRIAGRWKNDLSFLLRCRF